MRAWPCLLDAPNDSARSTPEVVILTRKAGPRKIPLGETKANTSNAPLRLRSGARRFGFTFPMGLTMAVNVAALRFQIETALAGRVPAPFAPRPVQVETAPFRIAEVDALTGGLPRGGLTEICGPPCSGRATLLLSALASGTAHALRPARWWMAATASIRIRPRLPA